jgi:hypothetical protein
MYLMSVLVMMIDGRESFHTMSVSVALCNLHDGHVDGYVRLDLDVMSRILYDPEYCDI